MLAVCIIYKQNKNQGSVEYKIFSLFFNREMNIT